MQHIYTDGGVIWDTNTKAGSTSGKGVVVGFRLVDEDKATVLYEWVGLLVPDDIGSNPIATSNHAELLAIIEALNWYCVYVKKNNLKVTKVSVHTDSKNAYHWFIGNYRTDNVPSRIFYQLHQVKKRCRKQGIFLFLWRLKGHPSKRQLEEGFVMSYDEYEKKDIKLPVSHHNVAVDANCTALKRRIEKGEHNITFWENIPQEGQV